MKAALIGITVVGTFGVGGQSTKSLVYFGLLRFRDLAFSLTARKEQDSEPDQDRLRDLSVGTSLRPGRRVASSICKPSGTESQPKNCFLDGYLGIP